MSVDKQGVSKIICVDMDHTLIGLDITVYVIKKILKSNPFQFFILLFFLLRGMSFFKEKAAHLYKIDPQILCYHHDLIDWIISQKEQGAYIVLATGAHQSYADSVGEYLGIFDAIYGSSGKINLIGVNKAEFLSSLYGHKKYIYCGDSQLDLAVWDSSESAVLVGVSDAVRSQVIEKNIVVLREFGKIEAL